MSGPISIQSQKLIPWLVERHVISKDYMKGLECIANKIDEFSKSSQEQIECVEAKPVRYFYAQEVLKHLEATDATRDFFGRASASIRTWRDIIARYESERINLAEISERLSELCYQLSKCKSAIADRQKLINDMQRKISECTATQHSKEAELDRFCKQFDIKDEHARLQLLEKASTLPQVLDEYVEKLKALQPIVDFHSSFIAFANSDTKRATCPTLQLLIKSGHVTVYEWRRGHPPNSVGESDDYLLQMIEMERKAVAAKEALNEADDQEIDFPDFDVPAETDLAEVDFGADLLTGINVIDISKKTSDTLEVENLTNSAPSGGQSESVGSVATGMDARRLLDSMEGRNALINELEELASFLMRFKANFVEFQTADLDLPEAGKKKKPGAINNESVAPIYHQIMLDAPMEIRSKTLDDVEAMSAAVQKAFDAITSETVTHLALLRLQVGYLERLMTLMQDLRHQANRSRSRASELSLAVEQAQAELSAAQAEMKDCLQERSQLVSYLERELSKLYNRDIKLIGAAIAM